MSAPNVEGTSNPGVITGGVFGTKVAASVTETVGFYGTTGAVQHATTGNVTGFAAGSGTASKSDSAWDGAAGATGYTVGDIVTALKALGILAA